MGTEALAVLKQMRVRACWATALVAVGVMVLTAGPTGRAQYGQSGGVLLQGQSRPQDGFGAGETDPVFGAKRLRAMNADRQKSMISDADKLLKLARQLDAEIASNPTNELTPEELHKVAEIEKLARNVKSKMAQSFSGAPQFHQPAPVSVGPGID